MNHNIYIALAVVAALAFVALRTNRRISLRVGDGKGLTVGEESRKCEDCRALLLAELTDKADALARVRNETVSRQLKYAENALDVVASALCDDYARELLAPHIEGDPKSSPYYEVYQARVDRFIRGRVVAGLRQVYIENHIAERTEKDWASHKAHVVTVIQADLKRYIDCEFSPVGEMKRADVEAFHVDRWPKISTLLTDSLDKAREIAIEAHKEMKRIRGG